MEFDDKEIETFLKKILFSATASLALKEETYELLASATRKSMIPQGASEVFVPGTLLSIPPIVMNEINECIKNGRAIDAMKILRAKTGLGLKESKDAVDRWRGLR